MKGKSFLIYAAYQARREELNGDSGPNEIGLTDRVLGYVRDESPCVRAFSVT